MKFAVTMVSVFLAAAASADVMTIGAQKDAMIFGNSAGADTNLSSGMGPAMFAGADGSLNKKRSLIQFDIAGNLPKGAQVTNVTLSLVLALAAGSGGGGSNTLPTRNIALFDLLQPWTEGLSGQGVAGIGGSGQGYTRSTGDASWDYASYNSSIWTSDGATILHGGNFSPTASATSTFTAPFNAATATALTTAGSVYTWSSAAMAADVQQWLVNPSSNDGWLMRALTGINSTGQTVDLEATGQSFLGFWTKDGAAANSNPILAPTLTITYTTTPEPIVLPLGAMMLLGLRRRRVTL